jgi:hypothetical protein
MELPDGSVLVHPEHFSFMMEEGNDNAESLAKRRVFPVHPDFAIVFIMNSNDTVKLPSWMPVAVVSDGAANISSVIQGPLGIGLQAFAAHLHLHSTKLRFSLHNAQSAAALAYRGQSVVQSVQDALLYRFLSTSARVVVDAAIAHSRLDKVGHAKSEKSATRTRSAHASENHLVPVIRYESNESNEAVLNRIETALFDAGECVLLCG